MNVQPKNNVCFSYPIIKQVAIKFLYLNIGVYNQIKIYKPIIIITDPENVNLVGKISWDWKLFIIIIIIG